MCDLDQCAISSQPFPFHLVTLALGKGGRGGVTEKKRRIRRKDIDHSVRKANVGFVKVPARCQNLSAQLVEKVEPGCWSPRVILTQTGEQTSKAARMCVSLSNPKPFPCFHV